MGCRVDRGLSSNEVLLGDCSVDPTGRNPSSGIGQEAGEAQMKPPRSDRVSGPHEQIHGQHGQADAPHSLQA